MKRRLRPAAARLAGVLVCLPLCALLMLAPAPGSSATGEAESRIVDIVDADTVRIDPPVDGHDQVRLAGIQAVKPPLDRPADRPWPLAVHATEALGELARDAPVRLVPAEREVDRYGRLLAHATSPTAGGFRASS